jgi:hypothetical protein
VGTTASHHSKKQQEQQGVARWGCLGGQQRNKNTRMEERSELLGRLHWFTLLLILTGFDYFSTFKMVIFPRLIFYIFNNLITTKNT